MLTLQPSSYVSLGEFKTLSWRIVRDTYNILVSQQTHLKLSHLQIERLLRLISSLERKIVASEASRVGYFVRPEFFQWYFGTLSLLEKKDFKKLRLRFLELSNGVFSNRHTYRIPGIPIFIQQTGKVLEEAVDDLSIHLSRLFNEPVAIRPIPLGTLLRDSQYKATLWKIRRALKIIREVWREQYDEILAVIRVLSLVKGAFLNGSSALIYHGLVILKPQTEWTELTFTDHLIHEASHQVLWTKQALGPLLLNPDKASLYSPVRWDKRPLNGVFHGTYVLCRLCMFFEKMLKKQSTEELFGRFEFHLGRFYKGMKVIKGNAKFTDRGKYFFGLMEKKYLQWRRKIPRPSEEAHRWAREYD